MKINWKVRLKNKTWLLAFLGTVAAFVYQLLGLADIVPAIGEDTTVQLIGIAVNLLVTLGIVCLLYTSTRDRSRRREDDYI